MEVIYFRTTSGLPTNVAEDVFLCLDHLETSVHKGRVYLVTFYIMISNL